VVFPLGGDADATMNGSHPPRRGLGSSATAGSEVGGWALAYDAGECPCVPLSTTAFCETRSHAAGGTVKDGSTCDARIRSHCISTAEGIPRLVRCIGKITKEHLAAHGWGHDTLAAGGCKCLNGRTAARLRPRSVAVQPDGSPGSAPKSRLYRFTSGSGEWTTFRESSGSAMFHLVSPEPAKVNCRRTCGGCLRRKGDRFEPEPGLPRSPPAVALYEGRQRRGLDWDHGRLYRYERGQVTWSAGRDHLVLPDVRPSPNHRMARSVRDVGRRSGSVRDAF